MSTSVSKMVAERNHRTLLELVLKPGNDVCADCKARAPRWASYNLGIFVCVNCASIHRKIGTHISKIKSITLDEWTKEQVEVMKERGNIKSNALYNPHEARHPPPTNMIGSERDSELEKFIRSKYEFKRFMDRKSSITSQQLVSDPRTTFAVPRSQSTPLADAAQTGRKASPGPLPPPKTPENLPPRLKLHPSVTVPSLSLNALPPTRSTSRPLPPLTTSDKLTVVSPPGQPAVTRPSIEKPVGQVWEDLISLQGPSQSSSFPLQYSPINATNPFSNLSAGQVRATTPLVASPVSVSVPGPQVPFVSPLSTPALHLNTTNPFNQMPQLSSSAGGMNGITVSTSSNHISSSPMPMPMTLSTPVTPSAPPVMGFPTGASFHTSPLPYVSAHTSPPVPALAFSSTPFIPAPSPTATVLAQSPFTPIGASGQIHGTTNPFSAMQMGQAALSGVPSQAVFGTTVSLNQQQQQQVGPVHGYGEWAGQDPRGTF